MNNHILPRKSIVVCLILSAALIAGIPEQQKLNALTRALTQSRAQKVELDGRVVVATETVARAKEKLREQQASRDKMLLAMGKAERELAKVDPETLWVFPPPTLPNWNPDCPYIWLRKELLAELPVEAFTSSGEVRSDVATVLVIDAASQQQLKTNLSRLVADYRALELASIERVEKPLSDVGTDGTVVTIRINPLPEQSANLKAQFASALSDAVGQQRADMLMPKADSWLYSQFRSARKEPETISVLRRANGMFNLVSKSGYGSCNYGGDFNAITHNIPPHLLDYIVKALDEAHGEL